MLLTSWLDSIDISTQVKTQWKVDVLLFVIGGVSLGEYNVVMHQFPMGSGLKVILGMSVLGFFIASDPGLLREHRLAIELNESGKHIKMDETLYHLTKNLYDSPAYAL